MKKKISIFSGFKEDLRYSMDYYTSLIFKNCKSNNYKFNSVIPELKYKSFFLNKNNLLRFNRYVSYPRQIKNKSGDLNHIIDHGYTHLISKLDPKKTIVTVHDLMGLVARDNVVDGLEYQHYPLLLKYSLSYLKQAKLIIAVSENTKKDIMHYLKISDDKIKVIYNPINPIFKNNMNIDKKKILKKLGIAWSGEYLIMITGNQIYKNHISSIKVIDKLSDKYRLKLIVLSNNSEYFKNIFNKLNFNTPFHFTGKLKLEELAELYQCISCLMFPSLYEGFGWPILEAMASGTPVISSNAGSIPEVTKGCIPLSDPHDLDFFMDQLKKILTDTGYRKGLIEDGYKNAERFSIDRFKKEILIQYENILSQ